MKTEHIVIIAVVAIILFVIWNNKCNEGYEGTAVATNSKAVISGNTPVTVVNTA